MNKIRVYIVDFIDEERKALFEIKAGWRLKHSQTIDKIVAAKEWSNE